MSDSFDSDNGVRDGFTEVTTQSWWDRIMGGFVAALIGLILVPVAVFVLYWNEGRAVEAIRALGRGAAAVVEVSATTLDPAAEGRRCASVTKLASRRGTALLDQRVRTATVHPFSR